MDLLLADEDLDSKEELNERIVVKQDELDSLVAKNKGESRAAKDIIAVLARLRDIAVEIERTMRLQACAQGDDSVMNILILI